MSFFFGYNSEGCIADSEDKKEYDSSFKFPNQNVTVSESKDADAVADMYDLNFGVEMPVYDVTKYFNKLKDLSVDIFKIFGHIEPYIVELFTIDTYEQIILLLKKLLFVIQNIYNVFNGYTYTDTDIQVYMTVKVLPALQSQIKIINKYISENNFNTLILTDTKNKLFNKAKSEVTVIIKTTYAAAGAVAIASSDDANIATEINVKTIYTAIPAMALISSTEAGNFIDGVRAEVVKKIESITDIELLYAAITKKSEYLDFYCNNKINVKLLFDPKKIKVGDSGPGVPGRTSCLLSQYKMKDVKESDDSRQSDAENFAKTKFEALIKTLTHASEVVGLDPADKTIVDEIIKKANNVTQATNVTEYNANKQALRVEIAKIEDFKTNPEDNDVSEEHVNIDAATTDAPAADTIITINGTKCTTTGEVKDEFYKIVGTTAEEAATAAAVTATAASSAAPVTATGASSAAPAEASSEEAASSATAAKAAAASPVAGTPSRLEELATEYYKFNIRKSKRTDTSTPGIRISTQAKIQSAIGDLQSTTSTPTATEYHDKFKKDKVFVDMSKDDSGLVCDLPKKHKKCEFEFEFDLNEFVFNLNEQKVSPQTNPESQLKNILLLHKGSWISIVFKNVHIPLRQTFGKFMLSDTDPYTKFDGNIKQGALMLMLSINNTDYPKPKSAGAVVAAQIDMSPFKDLFFMKTNPIIFGTINDSIIEFQYVRVTGDEIKSEQTKPGVFKSFKQSIIQGAQNFHQGQKKAADLVTRKQLFMQKTNSIVDGFRTNCINKTTGKVDAKKSNEYIISLYTSNIDEEQLKNIFGLTGKMPRLIFALTQSLIPGDTNVENSMLLIVRALAGDDNIKPWSEQSYTQPITVPVTVQGGGDGAITDENIEKATGIIKDMIKTLTEKKLMNPSVSSTFTNGLENAEQKIKLNTKDPDSIEISVPVPPPPADSTSGSATGASASASSSSPRDKLKGIFGSLFDSKSSSSSASSSSDGTNMETCGNTANVTCNGENLIVTITLKTSDLLNQCGITHENLLNMANQPLPPPQKDHGQPIIDHANSLPPDEAEAYIKGLTSAHFAHITDTHIQALKHNLQPIFRAAKAKAMAGANPSGAGAGAGAGAQNVTTKTKNNLSVSPTSITNLEVNKTQQLTISDGNNTSITYTSNDKQIATVNASGLVTGVTAGDTTIEIIQDGNDTTEAAKLTVKVIVVAATPEKPAPLSSKKPNTLSFTTVPSDPIPLDIATSSTTKTYNLVITNVPKSDVNKTTPFTYESSDPTVATVDANSGVVTGQAEGDCVINITQAATVEFAEGKLTAKIKVVNSSSKTPLPAKSADETKYDQLKEQYDAITKTTEELTKKSQKIIDKIKSITMSPNEIANEKRYYELKAQYEAVTKTTKELTKKSQEIIDKINTLIPGEIV